MSDRSRAPGNDLADVEARLRDMRKRKKVRWTMSQETAELAIAALATAGGADAHRSRAKSRRRKKRKKLL